MVQVNDITVTSLETITAMDITTGAFKWVLDELQESKIANSQETTDVTGRGGRLLNTLKKNKAVTVSGTNGLLSGGLMETQSGSSFTHNKITNVLYPDYLTVNNDEATTTYIATGTDGNEIESVYIHNADGTLGTELTQAAQVAAGKFTYTPGTKKLAFNTDEIADGTSIVVYYFRKIQADVLDNVSDHYSEKVALYIDGTAEDKCSNIYHIQFYIPKADFNGEFDVTLGGDQSTHAFEARSLAGACTGNASTLWTYTIFGENTEDYTG